MAGAGLVSGPFSHCTMLFRFVGTGGAAWGLILPLRLINLTGGQSPLPSVSSSVARGAHVTLWVPVAPTSSCYLEGDGGSVRRALSTVLVT